MSLRKGAFALLFAAAAAAQPPRGWNDYHIIMWSTGEPRDRSLWIDRLRELGFTAEQCTRGCDATPYVAKGFGFYVENLVSELAFLHSRRPLYDADWQGYTSSRDKKYLIRKPCLNDPAYWPAARTDVLRWVQPYPALRPLLYDLRDELSIGSYANPMDYCFGPHTLAAFREWLKSQYGSLEALNREWETSFSSWEAAAPMTTYEIKDRERAALAAGRPENYAPWADHRAFMDLTFAQALDRFRGYIRELDAVTPVGIEGTQMPSAWGGYDLWRLSRVVDWVEPYDIASSHEIFRSFLPPDTPVLGTVFGSDMPRIRRELWWRMLHGDRGVIVWDDEESRSIQKTQEDLPITARGRGLAEIFSELRPVARRMIGLRRLDDRIAVHYSQASIRAHWMFDSREDLDTWPRRFSSYEATYSRYARVRDSFLRVIEDLGLQYNLVSYEQIENGELTGGGYRVLLLPQSVAISEKEAAAIEAFVQAGGTVIADNMTATMNERCRRLARGRLDPLFGISRSAVGWRAGPAGASFHVGSTSQAPFEIFEPEVSLTTGAARYTAGGSPAVIENRIGSGRAVYFNLDMHHYGRYRLTPPRGDAYRDLFTALLRESGVEPAIRVVDAATGAPAPCVEVLRYKGPTSESIAVMRNPEFGATGYLKEAGYPDNSVLEQPARIRVLLDRASPLTEVRTGRFHSTTGSLEATLDPWSPVILRRATAVEPRSSRPRPPGRRR